MVAADAVMENKVVKQTVVGESDILLITELKSKKCRYKTSFTKTKNILLKFLEDDLPSRRKVRQLQVNLDNCQEEAVNIISELAKKYKEIGQIEKWMKTVEEINTMVNEQDMVHSFVEEYLSQRAGEASSVSSYLTSISSTLERRMTELTFHDNQDNIKFEDKYVEISSEGHGIQEGMKTFVTPIDKCSYSHRFSNQNRITNLEEFGKKRDTASLFDNSFS